LKGFQVKQVLELGPNCSEKMILGAVGKLMVDGIVQTLSPNSPSITVIADLGCGNGWLLDLLVQKLPKSRLGESWQEKISLIGIDKDPLLGEAFKSLLLGKADFKKADITKEIPLDDNSCSFAFLSQMDTVLSPADFRKIISLAKNKIVRGGYLGVLMVHPEYAKLIARNNSWLLRNFDSIHVYFEEKKRWYHGSGVAPTIFNNLNFKLMGQVDIKTEVPILQYNLFVNVK